MLRRLGLFRFKSFRDAILDFGSLTLLVGANASGKSNLRDALRFLHGVGLGYPLAEILGEKYGPGGILQWRGIRGGAREVAFGGASDFWLMCTVQPPQAKSRPYAHLEYGLQVDLSDKGIGPRVTREALYTRQDYLWDSDPEDDPPPQQDEHQIRIRHRRGGNPQEPGRISDFSATRPVLSQFPDRNDEPLNVRRACTSVLEIFQDIRFLDLDPNAIRQPSQPGQVILGDRGENLSSVLHGICQDPVLKNQLLGWLRSLTPMDVVDFAFQTDLSGRILVQLVEANGQKVSALSASDGTLRFLALVAALLSPDTGRIFFFEEFDNGIHPTRLHLLLQLVQQVCKEQQIQVIGTTHNPALLGFLEAEALTNALLVYRTETAADSRIRRISDLPDIRRVLKTEDLGSLHAAGWLEDAACFSEPDAGESETGGGPE
ncbi:AAA family ATPase [Candidatus Thiosymbion oneisti]|uniref:AAA family ATPase n=1 Tax=Candidatus Thiosymbion oneisti TaxID=589554 RepID=UPI000A6A8D3E|nr:ATP-binding protein [Candidatus Thiosymbion oneisti]